MHTDDSRRTSRDSGEENIRNSPPRQGKLGQSTPRDRVELLNLVEIKERYGITYGRIWRATKLGMIRAYSRPGHQAYYAATEIEEAFGLTGAYPPSSWAA